MRTLEIIGGIIPEAVDDDGLRQERQAGLLRAMADSLGCLLPWKLITAESSRCPFARENPNPYDETMLGILPGSSPRASTIGRFSLGL
jgi:hypothetical protein